MIMNSEELDQCALTSVLDKTENSTTLFRFGEVQIGMTSEDLNDLASA